MKRKLRLPSPAMVVAMIALLVALGGTAAAAKIVAHAKLADNALKLQGKTAAQVAALAGGRSAAPTVSVQTADIDLGGSVKKEFRLGCPSGMSAVNGGASTSNPPVYVEGRPLDASTWSIVIQNPTQSEEVGKVYVVCVG